MTPESLLADLRQRGVHVVADGDDLRCRAPRGALTNADLAALREHKATLIAQLGQDGAPGPKGEPEPLGDGDLLADLQRRGVRVTLGPNGYDLRLNPKASSPALFHEVVERQDEIRAALRVSG